MRENEVERYLKRRVEAEGGKCWKWVSPGRRGVPDRIVLLPGGRVLFVELKAPGQTERPDQVRVQDILRDLGCVVFSAVDSREKVEEVMRYAMAAVCVPAVQCGGDHRQPGAGALAVDGHGQNGDHADGDP